MGKVRKGDGIKMAAFLIQIGIEQFNASPTLRAQTRFNLLDIKAAEKVRKELIKQVDNK